MLSLHCNLLKRIVMETKEKTGMDAVAQVIFRHSAERPGYYLCHYGHLTSEGTFAEASELSFWDFLKTLEVSLYVSASFEEKFSESEMDICRFGYLSQEHFNEFVRWFAGSCTTVQLYPGMLVLTFDEQEEEDED